MKCQQTQKACNYLRSRVLTKDQMEMFHSRPALNTVVKVGFQMSLGKQLMSQSRDIDSHDGKRIPEREVVRLEVEEHRCPLFQKYTVLISKVFYLPELRMI